MVTRKLSLSESMLAASRIGLVVSTTVRGKLDHTVFTEAATSVISAHAALRSRLVTADGGYALRLDPSHDQNVEFRDCSPSALTAEFERPLSDGRTIRVVVLTGPVTQTVVFTVDHAIGDGRCVSALVSAVWQRYTALIDGHPVDSPVRQDDFPMPIEDGITHTFDEDDLGAFVARRAALVNGPAPALLAPDAAPAGGPGSVSGFDVERMELDADATAALFQTAKSAGLSVHALVCGVMLTVIRKYAGAPQGKATVVCQSPVDMRPRLSPKLAPQVMVFAASCIYHVIEADERSSAFDVGAQVAQQLREGTRCRDVTREVLTLPRLLEMPSPLVTCSVTNLGEVTLPLPAELELTDMHMLVLMNAPALIFSVFTLNGQLTVDLPYNKAFFTTELVRKIIDDLRTSFTALIREESRAPSLAS